MRVFTRDVLAEAVEKFDKWNTGRTFEPTGMMNTQILAEAARERLAQLPDTCERCKGTGEFRYLDSSGPISSDIYPCPVCHGTGNTYSAELVTQISLEFAEALMHTKGEMKAGAFVALCNAHAVAVLEALNGRH